MNERLADTRAAESSDCLSYEVRRFINATLIVLSAKSALEELVTAPNATTYTLFMSRFMAHVTQTMAGGFPFCFAFARACGGLVGEWTRNRVPVPELEYRRHCESVMRATPQAAEYLFEGPAFRNPLYKCLSLALRVPPSRQ